MSKRLIVQVTGELSIDLLSLTRGQTIPNGKAYYFSPDYDDWHVTTALGCAGYLEELVVELLKGDERVSVHGVRHPEQSKVPPERAQWLRQRPAEPTSGGISTSSTVWRAYPTEKPGETAVRISEWREREPFTHNYRYGRLVGPADLLVMVDGGRGFRQQPDGWPACLLNRADYPAHVILKFTHFTDYSRNKDGQLKSAAKGDPPNTLLSELIKSGLGARTTVVTSVDHLRACDVSIRQSLSWERMLDDVTHAVRTVRTGAPTQKHLFVNDDGKLMVYQVIVTIGTAGAVIIRDDGTRYLIFDLHGQEGDFDRQYPGQMMGGATSVVAALVDAWVKARLKGEADPDWPAAVKHGVGLSRFLMHRGFDWEDKQVRFPVKALAAELVRKLEPVGQDAVTPDWDHRVWSLETFGPQPVAVGRRDWSILEEQVRTDIFRKAEQIAYEGLANALPKVPVEQIGDWLSADRREIEGVRSVQNAIGEYLSGANHRTPLSIGVFGPPGAGKSTAIRNMAKSLGLTEDAELTFNLSQFHSPAELVPAFHRIRDLHMSGKQPLVFWDEFDTRLGDTPFGWLRYFLAPMQDGTFTENSAIHPIGGGIFVFAGATTASYEQFLMAGTDPAARNAKQPDFISRLRAYIDVLGPNPEAGPLNDRMHIIRRAALLHGCLKRNAPFLEQNGSMWIQQGVLNAFLLVPEYLHGARSIDTLVTMSTLREKLAYEVSSLPPERIIGMHTDPEHFQFFATQTDREPVWVGLAAEDWVKGEVAGQMAKEITAALTKEWPRRTFTFLADPALPGNLELLHQLLAPGRGIRGTIALLVPKSTAHQPDGHSLHGRVKVPCQRCYTSRECADHSVPLSIPAVPCTTIPVRRLDDPALCAAERGETIGRFAETLVAVYKDKSRSAGVSEALAAADPKKVMHWHPLP